MKKREQVYANIGLLLVALIWGSGFVVTKLLLGHIGPYYMLFYRFLISFLIMAFAFFKKFKLLDKENIKAGVLLGVFMFLGFVTQTVGLEFMEPGKQGFIVASNVVMVPFIYWAISKVKPDRYDIIGVILCFLGLGVLTTDGGSLGGLGRGEVLSFLSAIFFGFHVTFIGHYTRKHDPVLLTLLQMFTAGLLALVFARIKEGSLVVLTKESALPILYLGVFNTFIAFTLQNVSQKHTTPTNASIILSMESVFSMILAILFVNEKVTIRHLLGFVLVFVAVIISQTKLSFLKSEKSSKKKEDIDEDLLEENSY